MSRKSPNLMLSLSRCRYCKRYWHPAEGIVTSAGYCTQCAEARRGAAMLGLELKPITESDLQGPYLLPRRLRRS